MGDPVVYCVAGLWALVGTITLMHTAWFERQHTGRAYAWCCAWCGELLDGDHHEPQKSPEMCERCTELWRPFRESLRQLDDAFAQSMRELGVWITKRGRRDDG